MNTLSKSKSLVPWLNFVCIIWLQAASGTRSNFPSYSSQLKQLLCISHVQLNTLNVALDIGKLFGCFSTAAAKHLPLWLIFFIGIILGSVGYGVQFLSLVNKIVSLSYWQFFVLNILAGNSICWINTVCYQLVMKNFPIEHATVTTLTSSYSWLSGKLYTSMAVGIQEKGSPNASTYLLLNCLVPIGVALLVTPIFRDPKLIKTRETGSILIMFMVSIVISVCVAFESVAPPMEHASPRLRLMALVLMMIMLPLVIPLLMAVKQVILEKWQCKVILEVPRDVTDSNSKRVIQEIENRIKEEKEAMGGDENGGKEVERDDEKVVKVKLGDEHGVKELLLSVDFWLYFWVYACGATLAMVYLNNLRRISQSRGNSDSSFLLPMSFSFGFFGRLFSAMLDWFTRERRILSRPASMVILMIPMASSFFLLLNSSNLCLYISTGILGTCSAAITTNTASITSELFGSKNSSLNHNIVLANIPVGSLLFGYLAACNYEKESDGRNGICMGDECHRNTFVLWGFICSLGTILSFLLYLRTRSYYGKIIIP